MHRFPFQGVEEPFTLPLIRHWDAKKLVGRVSKEKKVGFGKSIMSTRYPITKARQPIVDCSASRSSTQAPVVVEDTGDCIRYVIPEGVLTDLDVKGIASDVSIMGLSGCF